MPDPTPTVTSLTHFTMLKQPCQMCYCVKKTPEEVILWKLLSGKLSTTKLDFDHSNAEQYKSPLPSRFLSFFIHFIIIILFLLVVFFLRKLEPLPLTKIPGSAPGIVKPNCLKIMNSMGWWKKIMIWQTKHNVFTNQPFNFFRLGHNTTFNYNNLKFGGAAVLE